MGRWFMHVLTGLGLLGLAAVVALIVVVYTGVLTPEKIRDVVKYNPLATQTAPVRAESTLNVNLIRLKRVDFNLPALGAGLKNGAGAVQAFGGGVLVAERTGRMFFFRETPEGEPSLLRVDMDVAVNNEGYEAYARSQGYAIKPGLNLGYGGTGMRLLDLQLLRDGRTLLVSYSHWDDNENCARTKLARTTVAMAGDAPKAEPWTPVWQASPCLGLSKRKAKPFSGHQSGGRMIELPDGRILMTTGDYKMDGYNRELSVADREMDYGKTQLIDLATGAVRIYSYGHRNPQGLAQLANGDIWSTEHGPSGGDEVNRIVEGADYGWPRVSLGLNCRDCPDQTAGRHDGYEKPSFAYLPSIGIGALIAPKNFASLWNGDLLHASLRAETLYHLRLDGGRVIYAEPAFIGERIRDMQELQDGRILLWTDSGKLIYLREDRDAALSDKLAAQLSKDAQVVLQECAECHVFDPGQATAGKIGLWGVVGRRLAADPAADYSEAMRAAGGAWTTEALDRYLAAPAAAIPGTTMPYDGVADEKVRRELISMLVQLR